ncbi:MAG: MFS transporter [Alphaproteobacteria bacterium]|nr:MFS transporter [Alphaproteobacteria bacterium]
MPSPSSSPLRLSPALRHGYGAAAASLAIANTAVMFFLLKFLVDEAGLAPALAGFVLLLGKAWDAVSDPLVGRLSDRTRTAMGARRPWILGGALPFVLLFAVLWRPLPLQGWLAAAGYTLLLVLYNTAYTAVVVPYGALTPGLTRDYDERTRLNAARMGWSMVGGIVAGVGLPVLVQQTGSFGRAAAVLGAVALPPLLWTVWATRGRDLPAAAAATTAAESFWSVLRVPAFRRTATLFLCAWSSIAVLSALVPFYVEHVLLHPGLLDAAFAAIQLSALLAIPLVSWLARRFEKHVAYGVAIASWAVVLVGLAAVPTGTGAPALVVAALVGPGVAAAHVLPWSMLPDVIEADAAERGHERAGAFYGAMTFLEKAATAVALWSLGIGLQAAGYVEGAAAQPESARLAIRVLIGPAPAVVLLAAAAFALLAPPLTRAAHGRLVARLATASSVD